ncbi:hypothetical protein LX36DRAFT_326009 [Colletotrichum falcatum]|nr:hypothetical protein LX36DRAFT_326009 [Colletotrichum falcatum]
MHVAQYGPSASGLRAPALRSGRWLPTQHDCQHEAAAPRHLATGTGRVCGRRRRFRQQPLLGPGTVSLRQRHSSEGALYTKQCPAVRPLAIFGERVTMRIMRFMSGAMGRADTVILATEERFQPGPEKNLRVLNDLAATNQDRPTVSAMVREIAASGLGSPADVHLAVTPPLSEENKPPLPPGGRRRNHRNGEGAGREA